MLLLLFVLLWALSCIAAPYPDELVLQHVPTVLVVAGLIAGRRRRWLSRQSESLVLLFMTLHVIGARYMYSYVPYDDWSYWLVGQSISSWFGFTRNHYDRLVHFAYGLLLVSPAREVLSRQLKPTGRGADWLALQFIVATSAVYEIAEWLVAVTLAPDWAEHYNGQQGDLWDAQKDMALAAVGAVAGLAVGKLTKYRRSRSQHFHKS
ncbi:MAG TPA: DUF2238 domain-containing protein [Pirellulales bacterium]|nr:DUF2238 domain-containing protein [Pirellulales bacterium]